MRLMKYVMGATFIVFIVSLYPRFKLSMKNSAVLLIRSSRDDRFVIEGLRRFAQQAETLEDAEVLFRDFGGKMPAINVVLMKMGSEEEAMRRAAVKVVGKVVELGGGKLLRDVGAMERLEQLEREEGSEELKEEIKMLRSKFVQ